MCKVVILAIGDEILKGFILNSNARFMGKALSEAGFEVIEHIVVGDSENMIRRTVEKSWEKGEIVISSGGLGPRLMIALNTLPKRFQVHTITLKIVWEWRMGFV